VDITIRPARGRDLPDILHLRDNAAVWLEKQGTDQWQEPWPSAWDQSRRIRWAIRERATWMLNDGATSVGTVTLFDEDLAGLWDGQEGNLDSALYLQRLIIHRDYAGRRLGEQVLDWAEQVAAARGRKWVRIDVWHNNLALQKYYTDRNFVSVGDVRPEVLGNPYLACYPSTALFQRPVPVPAFESRVTELKLWDALVSRSQ
jgi:ribosomal protein S18 acetylase RimI-like enzyme